MYLPAIYQFFPWYSTNIPQICIMLPEISDIILFLWLWGSCPEKIRVRGVEFKKFWKMFRVTMRSTFLLIFLYIFILNLLWFI